nr:DUF1033 family protein [Bacillus salacetis]
MASYSVIRMSGEAEPWWFFSDWEKDITEKMEFTNEKEAFEQFLALVRELSGEYKNRKQKKNTVAFWDEGEKVFCESCDDDLQIYHGLILMDGKDLKVFTNEEKQELQTVMENVVPR